MSPGELTRSLSVVDRREAAGWSPEVCAAVRGALLLDGLAALVLAGTVERAALRAAQAEWLRLVRRTYRPNRYQRIQSMGHYEVFTPPSAAWMREAQRAFTDMVWDAP